MSTAPTKEESRSRPCIQFQPRGCRTADGEPLWRCALVVFAGIPFALGKYFELKFPDPFDSGSYVYSAQHVLSGARVGYEEKPSAQAGTLLVNMLGVTLSGFNETGSKVLQGLFQAAAFAFLFVTIRRLYGSLAAVISVVVASVYLSAPVIAKFGNVKEQFMIALMIMGICCFVWYHLERKVVVGAADRGFADRRADVQADGRLRHRGGRPVHAGPAAFCTVTAGRRSAWTSCCWSPARRSS